ncbi:MAG: hypothetical protein IT162_02200 [Bryobacterales bacterium]|nr:hypothetical protein [Bryobacterales bacterium]
MPLNFNSARRLLHRGGAAGDKLEGMIGEGFAAPTTRPDPLRWWKVALGVLAVANLAAFFLLVKPVGGSTADLDARLADLQMQVKRQQLSLRTSRDMTRKIDGARAEHEQFMATHFMDRRTMSSTILSEIKDSAASAGLVAKEHSFAFEAIEGADNLGLMTITANYEGDYGQLVKFVNLIDRSKRFLIIDNMQAAPQQQGGKLTARFKINAFVRDSPRNVALAAAASAPAPPAEPINAKPGAEQQ